MTAPSHANSSPPGPAATGPGLAEVLLVWALSGVLVAAIFVTYARVPAQELYNVHRGGLAGGASRALIVLNFPIAVLAAVLLPIVVARLLTHPSVAAAPRRWAVIAVAVLAVPLCALTVWPGVVDQSNLDAKPVNALPALGVALTLALTVIAGRLCGLGSFAPPGRGDILRLGLAGCLLIPALPWVFADLGIYIGDIPVLGNPFMSREIVPPDAALPVVHLGHHHGLDGVVFAFSALALSRVLGQLPPSRLRGVLTFALAFTLVYGVANAANDFWGEQLFKRGWTSLHFPSVLRPAATPAWGVLLLAAVVVCLLLGRVAHRTHPARPLT